ncbi:MAG: hypothetical protein RJA60_532 [Actinomycetota bacterium]
MGHVLAIDTSSGTSVAVLKDGIALAEIEIADTPEATPNQSAMQSTMRSSRPASRLAAFTPSQLVAVQHRLLA